jgi:hypothetical protein
VPWLDGAVSLACPFCVALEPTLSQRRDAAAVTILAEVEKALDARLTRVRVHKVLSGDERINGAETLDIAIEEGLRPGSLLVAFGNSAAGAAPGEFAWHAVALNEASYAYVAREPSLKTPAAERLRYFAPLLEHPDPSIAGDAYLEFGHAAFGDVERVADALPFARMREWLVEPKIPPERKGFYGLALGLATDAVQKRANAAVLEKLILLPEDDFRAGFDGIVGGYLLSAGDVGLQLIETRYLANPRAADGDVRHVLVALRFYYEYGREIPNERLCAALRRALDRPEFAAAAITDLARWSDWESVDRIAGLYMRPAFSDPAVRRAIVGYLSSCPRPQAAEALARIRASDPQGVAAAEAWISRTTGTGSDGR